MAMKPIHVNPKEKSSSLWKQGLIIIVSALFYISIGAMIFVVLKLIKGLI